MSHTFELNIDEICNDLLDFKSIFGKESFQLEIGFSNAFFLSEYANRYPETGFLGIEIKRKYFNKGKRNLKRLLNQDNVRGIHFEAMAIVSELIPFETLDAIHVYFPDPWPKKKHNKNRLLSKESMRVFANRLKKGGRLYIATDHPDYGEMIGREIYGVLDLFNKLPYGEKDRDIKTKWEKRQINEGWDIYYYLLEKK